MNVPEQWLPIPHHEGYEASSLGRIRSRWIRGGSHTRGRQMGDQWRILAGWVAARGYRHVNAIKGDTCAVRPVHQLVAEAFHGPRPPGREVRHLNGDCLDNRAENLQWGTRSENHHDRVRHGTHSNAIKTHCKRGHPFSPENTYIIPNSGSRSCRSCTRERQERQKAGSARVVPSSPGPGSPAA